MSTGTPLLNDFSVELDPGKALADLRSNDIVAYHHVQEYVAAQLQQNAVSITMPATIPAGIAGQAYELFLASTGGEPVTWEQYGDPISGEAIIRDQQTGAWKWVVATLPAASTPAIKFRAKGANGTFDTKEYTFSILSSMTNAAITDSTLSALRVGLAAKWNFTCTGTGPYRFRWISGQPMPTGVAFTTDSVDDPSTQNVLTGAPVAGQERAGASMVIGITGANGTEVQKTFASGCNINRDPDCLNENAVPVLTPGVSWNFTFQLVGMENGVAATIARTGGAAWPAWVTSLTSAGVLSGTDPTAAAGTSTDNIVCTVTAGSKTRDVNIRLTVDNVSVSNAPPIAASYWFDAEAGVSVTGGTVQTWADQQASLSASSSGYTAPTPESSTHSIAISGAPTRQNLYTASMSLAVPWYIADYVYIPTGISDGVSRTIIQDASIDPRIGYRDNGSSQHGIRLTVGGVTAGGSETVTRGAWNLVEVWCASDGSGGICVNGGTDTTFAAGTFTTPTAWSGLMFGGSTDGTSFNHKQHRLFFKNSIPTSPNRASIRTWLQANWATGGGGTVTPPTLTVTDERIDPRCVGYLVPARGFADATANMQWNAMRGNWNPDTDTSATFNQLPYIPNQQNYWTGVVRNIPETGLVVNSAGVKGLEIVDCPVNGPAYAMLKNYGGIDTPHSDTWNGWARARARTRPMDCYNRRLDATPADEVWQAMRIVFGPGSFTNTDVKQGVFALTHLVTSDFTLFTPANGYLLNGPSLTVSTDVAEGSQGGSRLAFEVSRWDQSTGRINQGRPAVWVCGQANNVAPADVAPAELVIYDFVMQYKISYLDSEGFINVWLKSPRHYGGAVQKIVQDLGNNFPRDTRALGSAAGPQVYDWKNALKKSNGEAARKWTAPNTSHTIWVGPNIVFIAGSAPGYPTLTPAMLFDLIEKRAKRATASS